LGSANFKQNIHKKGNVAKWTTRWVKHRRNKLHETGFKQ
jgi:hypothetical protein